MNTIKVHWASIASVLKLLNPPTALQEDTLHNVIRRMSILRPRTQEVLPRWHLSVVLKGLMKPPFAINGSDRNLSLEFLSYKTTFLIVLATGARASSSFLGSLQHRIQDFGFRSETSVHSNGSQVYSKESMSWTHSETIGIPRNSSFISKGSWKAPVSHKGTGRLPVTICRKSERGSTTETLCAFLPGHPALHYTLQTLGSRDHLPDLGKFIWIRSTQDSSSWHQSNSCLHSLL